jgi:hypothetical protein
MIHMNNSIIYCQEIQIKEITILNQSNICIASFLRKQIQVYIIFPCSKKYIQTLYLHILCFISLSPKPNIQTLYIASPVSFTLTFESENQLVA